MHKGLFRALLAALVLASGSAAAAGVVVGKSEIAFTMKQMGVNFDGRFKQWKADAVFDPAAPDKAKADVDVDLASIDLASADSEAEARGPQWFNTAKFPVAHFASTSVRSVGAEAITSYTYSPFDRLRNPSRSSETQK